MKSWHSGVASRACLRGQDCSECPGQAGKTGLLFLEDNVQGWKFSRENCLLPDPFSPLPDSIDSQLQRMSGEISVLSKFGTSCL